MDSKTIGILGGGQLGRMIVEAAQRLNINTVVLDKGPDGPAKQINAIGDHVDGAFTDYASISALAKKCDVLTVEIEHIDVEALKRVQEENPSLEVYPLPDTIKLIQDKYLQKKHLAQSGVAVVDSVDVPSNTVADLHAIGDKFGYPFMLKARTLAYDGRGNFIVKSADKCAEALEFLKDRPLYAEKWCPFTKELAVMVVRALDGTVHAYPTVETVHKNNICHLVYAPARASDGERSRASLLAKNAVKSFPGCGIFGVEMFLLANGELLVNEIAPRPHNLGHYTIDACVTSQFEAHVRAVVGLPMPARFTEFLTTSTNAIMLNVLGGEKPNSELEFCNRALQTPHALVYLYGKSTRPERKMGHINIVTSSMFDAENKLNKILGNSSSDTEVKESSEAPLVGIIMGSDSDLPVMSAAARILQQFEVPFELTIVSAHRTPHRMNQYAMEAHQRGLKCIIAGAGGAAHLPGMVAAATPLPVVGVPVKGSVLDGVDSLHSILQMPRGIPVATVAINNSTNAALLAVRIVGAFQGKYLEKMAAYMASMEKEVLAKAEKLEKAGFEDYLVGMKK